MNIAAWLDGLGLGRYAQAFAQHGVDEETLARTTEADLATIGVKSVGHRRRLMDAIGALAQDGMTAGAPPAAAPPVATSAAPAHKSQDAQPMIGREEELALLLERWAQAQGGEGQAVLLVGEPGIGKSRLARALLDACAGQPRHVRWQCSPYHTGSALWPVIQELAGSVGLQTQDSGDAALDKIEMLAGRNAQASSLYATLLGLSGNLRHGPLTMTPQVLRERTLELMVEQLLEMAEQRALLVMVEDAQWIDPTTLELISRCLERINTARMLFVIISRPDHEPALGAHPGVRRLWLNRLSGASAQALVLQLGGLDLQLTTRQAIVAQSKGVPLFLEELTKAVLETGEAGAIPASLMARLDRVAEVREVAQTAACIGREFDLELLHAVAEHPQSVASAMDKLVAAEFVFQRGCGANPRFTFKHALMQEAACASLLPARRQAIHARILRALEARGEHTPPEILAHHAVHARQMDKAIACWGHAGSAALAQSAYVEAASYLESAIELIQTQADGTDRRAQELELQLQLGQAHTAVQGYGAQATIKDFKRANELLDASAGKAAHDMRVRYGLWVWHWARAELKDSLQLAGRALAAAEAGGSPEALLHAHRMVGSSRLCLGDFAEARDHLEQAMGLVDSAKRGELTAQLGIDPGVQTLGHLALALCIPGYADQSRQLQERAHLIGSAVPHVNAKAQMHILCALCAACVRDPATVGTEARALAALAARYRLPDYSEHADVLLAWASSGTGPPAEELVRAGERALHRIVARGTRVWVPLLMACQANALAACGHQAEALNTIEGALSESRETAQGWCDAELWRVRGELLLCDARHEPSQALECFEQAATIARERGAKLWELRAAASLARLLGGRGESTKAMDVLAPVYDWFTEGFDTVDMVEARTLLGALERDGGRQPS